MTDKTYGGMTAVQLRKLYCYDTLAARVVRELLDAVEGSRGEVEHDKMLARTLDQMLAKVDELICDRMKSDSHGTLAKALETAQNVRFMLSEFFAVPVAPVVAEDEAAVTTRLGDHTCKRVDYPDQDALYHTAIGPGRPFQLYRHEAVALYRNIGAALGYAAPVVASAALTDLLCRCTELMELSEKGESQQTALRALAATYDPGIPAHDRRSMAISQTHREAICAMLSAHTAAPAADDGASDTPRYAEWLHLRAHGQWRDGVPEWARDHFGRMNDLTAASAIIEELAAVAQAADRLNARDAARYRWLREQQWNESELFVVAGGKSRVHYGTDCPTDERLDEAIDTAIAQRDGGEG
ncbi:hypothetical protein [Pararobbsia silviterrae]|uniref:Uncharacterized protein n=1 Tax=Pararobbsia silviterrae TaxID=1792498 RepID=A0A494Y2B1_9BURK|nr:hypothetical protein [Pararobbsia silviterrae]RKP56399.1 hypothetical protein D7S86_08360 [Pararobbsia silviterrae]